MFPSFVLLSSTLPYTPQTIPSDLPLMSSMDMKNTKLNPFWNIADQVDQFNTSSNGKVIQNQNPHGNQDPLCTKPLEISYNNMNKTTPFSAASLKTPYCRFRRTVTCIPAVTLPSAPYTPDQA